MVLEIEFATPHGFLDGSSSRNMHRMSFHGFSLKVLLLGGKIFRQSACSVKGTASHKSFV